MRRASRHRVSPFLVTFLTVVTSGLAPAAKAVAPAALVNTSGVVDFAVAHVPGDGYILAWQDPLSRRLRARRVSAAGTPQGDVGGMPDLPSGIQGPALAVAPSGRWLAIWTQPAGADQVGLAGALFNAQDRLVRRFELPDPIPDPGGLVTSFGAHVAALPGGGFAVAFTVGIQDDPLADPINPSDTDAYLLRLDRQGRQVGGAVRVHADAEGFQAASDVGASGAGIVVSWTSWSRDLADDREVFVRVFAPDLTPLSGEVAVNQSPIPPERTLGNADLAVGADGRFVVAWEGERSRGSGIGDVLVRAFDAAGEPASGEAPVEAIAGAPLARPSADVTAEDEVWVAWIQFTDLPMWPIPLPVIAARRFDLSGAPLERSSTSDQLERRTDGGRR